MDAGLSHLLKSIAVHRSFTPNDLKSIDDPFTKITTYGPKALWKISTDKLSNFYTEYCDMVKDNVQGNYCVAEIPGKSGPVILNGIMRFSRNKNDDFDQFIRHMINSIQSTFTEVLQLSSEEYEFLCVVTHTDELVKINNEYVWEFCLYFPYCVVDIDYQLNGLRPLIIERLRANNVFSSLVQQPINDWDSDKARGHEGAILTDIPGRPVPMYLSREKPNTSPLLYKNIYKLIPEDCIFDEGDYDISCPLNEGLFLPSNHSHHQRGILDREMFVEFEEVQEDNMDNPDCIFWLPLFLSVHFWDKIALPRVQDDEGEKQLYNIVDGQVDDPLHAQARLFLDMINTDRKGEFCYWRDIGKCLYNIFNGNEEGMELWKIFSGEELHTKCQKTYQTFNVKNYLTIRSLAWYAREDSPKEYQGWHYNWCLPALEMASSCLESDVAECFGRIYWLDFTCSSVLKSSIYQYRNHGWSVSEGGVGISKLISTDFVKRFEAYRTTISSLIEGTDDPNAKTHNEVLMKKLQALISRLKKHTFKTNVLKEVKEWFYDEDFKKVIDENPAYVRTMNGIIECCDDCAVFRPGKPEDYITKSTFSHYPKHFYWGHPIVMRVRNWIRQVFRDKDLENHFLKDAASFLFGKNAEKYFRVWSGDNGDNSKSMIVKLFECALGMYIIKLPTYVFSGITSSGPSPELARAKGAHGAIAQEPDDEEEFRGGKIKGLTGGDSFFARFNHDDGGEVTAMFKLVLMCNKIPVIPSGGQAVKNRLLIFPFLSTWRDDAPETEEEQMAAGIFKKDPFFEDTIPELAEGFLWIMVQMYKDYKREGLKKSPKLVREYTDKYWEENDVYNVFSRETLDQVFKDSEKEHIDDNVGITHTEIYREFKLWHKTNFPHAQIPNSPTVKSELIKRLGKQHKNKWLGIKFIQKVVSLN